MLVMVCLSWSSVCDDLVLLIARLVPVMVPLSCLECPVSSLVVPETCPVLVLSAVVLFLVA